MKNKQNIQLLQWYFSFLIKDFNFSLKNVKSYDYALYVKFISNTIGIYYTYEFRDFVPRLQFTKLNKEELNVRLGLYTIRELYKDKNYKLQSFYLDEIILFKGGDEYLEYFKNITKIDDAIRISAELIKKYAMDFVEGNELSFIKIDKWFRTKVT